MPLTQQFRKLEPLLLEFVTLSLKLLDHVGELLQSRRVGRVVARQLLVQVGDLWGAAHAHRRPMGVRTDAVPIDVRVGSQPLFDCVKR